MREIVGSIEREYLRYKELAERTFAQVRDDELARVPAADGNSIAILVWHVSGNLESRFTDFFSTDGEKPWRQRDAEFEPREVDRRALLLKWEEGWAVLFGTLAHVADADLGRTVTIRGEALAARDALHRSLAHTSYHVGQIVLLGRSLRGTEWQSLTIPRRHSR